MYHAYGTSGFVSGMSNFSQFPSGGSWMSEKYRYWGIVLLSINCQ